MSESRCNLLCSGIPKVSCPLCGKQLSSESTLQKHVSSVHEKIRRFGCEHCSHKASTPGNLQQHIDSFHLGIKHECDICQASFSLAYFETVLWIRIRIGSVFRNYVDPYS